MANNEANCVLEQVVDGELVTLYPVTKAECVQGLSERIGTEIQPTVQELQTNINTKADSSALSTTDSRVANLQQQVNNIASLPEGSTTGDAELVQARVGVDGTNYQNLKTRLDTEMTDVKEDLSEISDRLTAVGGLSRTLKPTWTIGKYIKDTGAVTNAGNTLAVTDFIDVVETDIAKCFGVNMINSLSMPSIHYYDSDKNHIGYVYATGDYDMTSDLAENGAKYIRLSHYIHNLYPLENVTVFFETKGTIDSMDERLCYVENKTERIGTDFSKQFVNVLAVHNTSENLKFLNNGVPIDNPNWCTLVDYVPVKSNTTYSIKFAGQFNGYPQVKMSFYKGDYTYISEITHASNTGYTTPNDCAFIRMSTTNTNYNVNDHDNFDDCFMEEVADSTLVVVVNNNEFFSNMYPLTTLYGKKWSMFGDSITENNYRSNANYHDYVRAETGIITNNVALGGSGYKNRDDNNNAFYQIALKTIDNWSDSDVITIMGGVNDMWSMIGNYGLGEATDTFIEPTDITKNTNNTVMACFNKMLDVTIENAPNSRIGVISPLPCYHTEGSKIYVEVPYDEDCNMNKFVNECKKACDLRGIPYLDLFHNSGLRPWNSDFNTKYFKCISSDSPDGLHPNEYGHKWFYPMVREFMKSLI